MAARRASSATVPRDAGQLAVLAGAEAVGAVAGAAVVLAAAHGGVVEVVDLRGAAASPGSRQARLGHTHVVAGPSFSGVSGDTSFRRFARRIAMPSLD